MIPRSRLTLTNRSPIVQITQTVEELRARARRLGLTIKAWNAGYYGKSYSLRRRSALIEVQPRDVVDLERWISDIEAEVGHARPSDEHLDTAVDAVRGRRATDA